MSSVMFIQVRVSQCSLYLTENTVVVHYKNQPVKSFRKIIAYKC
jgi:hypothetical protein